MSIDFILDLDRTIQQGGTIYGCQGMGQGKWEFAKNIDSIRKVAKRVATARRSPVAIMQFLPTSAALPESSFLIATKIGDDEEKGAANITWSTVGSFDAAETMRDVSKGPSPFFVIQNEEVAQP